MTHHQAIQSIRTHHIALVAMAMTLLFACGMGQRASTPVPELHVDVLLAGTQGGGRGPEPSAGWITSREDLEQLMDTLKSGRLPAQDRAAALGIDFNASRILLVRMGQKPTAGYSLKLDPASCRISKSTAAVSLVWSEPAPGMVTAQVITTPYILLTISKEGYDSVKVVDQHGQARFDVPVAE